MFSNTLLSFLELPSLQGTNSCFRDMPETSYTTKTGRLLDHTSKTGDATSEPFSTEKKKNLNVFTDCIHRRHSRSQTVKYDDGEETCKLKEIHSQF